MDALARPTRQQSTRGQPVLCMIANKVGKFTITMSGKELHFQGKSLGAEDYTIPMANVERISMCTGTTVGYTFVPLKNVTDVEAVCAIVACFSPLDKEADVTTLASDAIMKSHFRRLLGKLVKKPAMQVFSRCIAEIHKATQEESPGEALISTGRYGGYLEFSQTVEYVIGKFSVIEPAQPNRSTGDYCLAKKLTVSQGMIFFRDTEVVFVAMDNPLKTNSAKYNCAAYVTFPQIERVIYEIGKVTIGFVLSSKRIVVITVDPEATGVAEEKLWQDVQKYLKSKPMDYFEVPSVANYNADATGATVVETVVEAPNGIVDQDAQDTPLQQKGGTSATTPTVTEVETTVTVAEEEKSGGSAEGKDDKSEDAVSVTSEHVAMVGSQTEGETDKGVSDEILTQKAKTPPVDTSLTPSTSAPSSTSVPTQPIPLSTASNAFTNGSPPPAINPLFDHAPYANIGDRKLCVAVNPTALDELIERGIDALRLKAKEYKVAGIVLPQPGDKVPWAVTIYGGTSRDRTKCADYFMFKANQSHELHVSRLVAGQVKEKLVGFHARPPPYVADFKRLTQIYRPLPAGENIIITTVTMPRAYHPFVIGDHARHARLLALNEKFNVSVIGPFGIFGRIVGQGLNDIKIHGTAEDGGNAAKDMKKSQTKLDRMKKLTMTAPIEVIHNVIGATLDEQEEAAVRFKCNHIYVGDKEDLIVFGTVKTAPAAVKKLLKSFDEEKEIIRLADLEGETTTETESTPVQDAGLSDSAAAPTRTVSERTADEATTELNAAAAAASIYAVSSLPARIPLSEPAPSPATTSSRAPTKKKKAPVRSSIKQREADQRAKGLVYSKLPQSRITFSDLPTNELLSTFDALVENANAMIDDKNTASAVSPSRSVKRAAAAAKKKESKKNEGTAEEEGEESDDEIERREYEKRKIKLFGDALPVDVDVPLQVREPTRQEITDGNEVLYKLFEKWSTRPVGKKWDMRTEWNLLKRKMKIRMFEECARCVLKNCQADDVLVYLHCATVYNRARAKLTRTPAQKKKIKEQQRVAHKKQYDTLRAAAVKKAARLLPSQTSPEMDSDDGSEYESGMEREKEENTVNGEEEDMDTGSTPDGEDEPMETDEGGENNA